MVRADVDLDAILAGLASPLPLRQNEAFLAICELRSDAEVDEIALRYPTLPEPARLHVLRYLSRVGSNHAQACLVEVLQTGEPAERKQARLALDAVPAESKIDTLLGLLQDKDPALRLYAVRSLRKTRNDKIAAPLCMLFQESEPPLRLEILKTLEGVQHLHVLSLAERAVDDASDEVVLQAIQVLRNRAQPGSPRPILRCLSHPSPAVRAKACWGLNRLRSRNAQAELLKRLSLDPEEKVRSEAAASLAAYPSRPSARGLFKTATSDASERVRMLCGFSLVSMPGEASPRTLLAGLRKGNEASRRFAIDQLSHRAERRAVPLLVATLKRETDPLPQRIAAAEALGRFQDPKAIAPLAAVLNAPSPLAYAAAHALCQCVGLSLNLLSPLLRTRASLPEPLLQVFALHLAMAVQVIPLPPPILDEIREWCASPFPQLRYLALRSLAHAGEARDLAFLKHMARTEEDPDSLWMVDRAARSIFLRHPEEVRALLRSREIPGGPEFWGWLRMASANLDPRTEWVRAVLDARDPDSKGRDHAGAVLLWWSRRAPDLLVPVLLDPALASSGAAVLLRCLERSGRSRRLTVAEAEAVRRHLESGSPQLRREALGAARRAGPEVLLDSVVRLAEHAQDAGEREDGRETVRHWLAGVAG